MRQWLLYVGPGVALFFIGLAFSSQPATKEAAALCYTIGGLYLVVIAPIYRRRWQARRRARSWFDLQRAKEPYKRRLARRD
jgi:cell division protein FtsW (lipid II flippase)